MPYVMLSKVKRAQGIDLTTRLSSYWTKVQYTGSPLSFSD